MFLEQDLYEFTLSLAAAFGINLPTWNLLQWPPEPAKTETGHHSVDRPA